jgi:hypothetical protein
MTRDTAPPGITEKLLDETNAAFRTLAVYNHASEHVMCALGVDCGLRLAWWTSSGHPSAFPAAWKETNQRVLYEESCAVPTGCPIYCFIPPDPPASGRWMLHAWHGVWYQTLTFRVLAVREGTSDDWWPLWEAVQTFEVEKEVLAEAEPKIWGAAFGGCRLVWADRTRDLIEFPTDEAIAAGAAQVRDMAEAVLAASGGCGVLP